ncbi:MAG: aconitate hydratase AcnA [Rickettsiales bacterium]|nr:aconitate hydratase AcnA [Rickettsiales bacterium]
MTKEFVKKSSLKLTKKEYKFFSIEEAAKKLGKDISKLPFSLKVLLENLVRNFDGDVINESHIANLIDSVKNPEKRVEISYIPARVLMQDFTGVPAVVDLAAMRDAVKKMNKDPKKINPLVPVDLVIDHSVQVDFSASKNAFEQNVNLEMKRNIERYEFLKWAQKSFNNFRVVPPGTGICHQVNLENLARVVWSKEVDGETMVYPDTVVGTDSHTTMINGLAVLGWGVGGIEAEAAMLGQPVSMLIPEVIGFKLVGKLKEGITATDLVLTVTNILRKKGVVGKFVEFFGPALDNLALADRATIANMAPEYGATCGIFPIDNETINYLKLTGRSHETIELVEAYAKAQNMFCENHNSAPEFSEIIELDISTVNPNMAGPKRPQDRIDVSHVDESFEQLLAEVGGSQDKKRTLIPEINADLGDGDVAIAAITSCTNTSNPSVLIAAGLVAKKAVEKGLKVKNFVKTSFAPGSQVVTEYLEKAGLQTYLDKLGFNLVGYGCTTCIGNSGPLHEKISETIKSKNILVASVISGNRNFEGRVHPLVKANYLASPPLVVAYALLGNIRPDITNDTIGLDNQGKKVFLKDIWPTKQEINEVINSTITRELFERKYSNLFDGDKSWQEISVEKSDTYVWNKESTYIRLPNFFDNLHRENAAEIKSAKILGIFGDSITTDHISPAGDIAIASPAAKYLEEKSVSKVDFNSYGARRGNHEVMMRGTFANIRIKNEMLAGKEGGFTKINGKDDVVSIYDAAMFYKEKNTPLVIFAGKEYGTGSSRDWAAKGTFLLGVKAVVAESFERIHRSNLIGMGVMPLIFKPLQDRKTLKLKGDETIDILGISPNIKPKQDLKCVITRSDSSKEEITLTCGLDTSNEVEYFNFGGILQFVMNQIIN